MSCRCHFCVIAPGQVGNTAPFEETLQRWRAVGNIVIRLGMGLKSELNQSIKQAQYINLM